MEHKESHACLLACHAHAYTVHTVCKITCTLPIYPFDSKLHSFEVHDGNGPIASLSNAPLHSLPGGEGQEGPLLKGSNTLCGRKHDERSAPVNTVIHHTNTEGNLVHK